MNTTQPERISRVDDVLDSRDITARIEHLRQLRQAGPVDLGPEDNTTDQDTLFHELAALEDVERQGIAAAPDWLYGATLIHDAHFEDYARELAEDIGAVNTEAGWPNGFIDWGRAAEALVIDYIDIDFDGQTYWTRG